MAKTNWQDPQTSEVRSTDISGLQEAVSKLEDSIGMETVAETDIPLTEVYISEEDRYRIFQAPAGKRNWVSSPTPVIKRNGVVIDSGFVIDYGGGAIALSVNDMGGYTYTADATYVTPLATSVNEHLADYANKFPDNAGAHNSIFRGKNLGSTPDYTNITNGSFKDMYIGDYWTINGINWRIAAFNYYRNTGDALVPGNHVVIVPDTLLYSHVMNDSNTTEGGYTGSKMYTEGLEQAKTIINNAFSGHVVTFRAYLCNAAVDGKASAGGWVDSTVDLMNEIMVYGSVVNGHSTYGLYNIGTEKSQLPLFALNPQSINTRYSYWLRDIASAANFALVDYPGFANHYRAGISIVVRPRFLIS